MKKISILKAETFESIVEKATIAADADIVLKVPKGSLLAENVKHLRALQKEVTRVGKHFSIETVDDKLLEFASKLGIEAFNPFFSTANQFSDIIPKSTRRGEMTAASASSSRVPRAIRVKETKTAPVQKPAPEIRQESVQEPIAPRAPEMSEMNEASSPAPRRFPFRTTLALLGVIVIVGGGIAFWSASARATIVVNRQQYPWKWNDRVAVDPRIKETNVKTLSIPGQSFIVRDTFERRFPASGTRQAQEKARGEITVYNAFSTKPQFLIQNTRFQAPDGKIFRIVNSVTVPGGTGVGSAFRAASITVPVAADQPGEAYNIPATPKFTIPGFSGTPKFIGFYGVSEKPMAGGFIGTVNYPTASDLEKAESELRQEADAALRDRLSRQIPQGLILPDGARLFRILEKKTDDRTGGDKKFAIKIDAELRAVAFQESDLLSLLAQLGENNLGTEKELLRSNIVYGEGESSLASQSSVLSLPLAFEGTFTDRFDVASLKSLFSGKRTRDVGSIQVEGAEDVTGSVRPFWMRRIPQDTGRITIEFR